MSKCPICGKSNHLSTRFPGGGARCECDQDLVDLALEIGSTFDWVTPASDLTGIPVGCFLILSVLAIAAIVASKGLWG